MIKKIVDIMEVYTFASVGFVVLKVKMGAFCSNWTWTLFLTLGICILSYN